MWMKYKIFTQLDQNVQLLQEKKADYICQTRSELVVLCSTDHLLR